MEVGLRGGGSGLVGVAGCILKVIRSGKRSFSREGVGAVQVLDDVLRHPSSVC